MSVPQSNGTSHGSEPSTASVLSDSATVTGSPQNSTFASTSTGIPASGLPAVIPPPDQHTGRSLIVCFDGTGDQLVPTACFTTENLTSSTGLTQTCVVSATIVFPTLTGDTEFKYHRVLYHAEKG